MKNNIIATVASFGVPLFFWMLATNSQVVTVGVIAVFLLGLMWFARLVVKELLDERDARIKVRNEQARMGKTV